MQKENLKNYMVISMKNSLIIFLLIFSFSSLHARYKPHVTKQIKGQEYYLKACSSCHGDGNRGGNLYSSIEWKHLFFDNAKDLKELHIDEEGEKQVIQYLEGKDFNHEKKKLLKFLQEFSYDSDTIPTCN